MGAQAGILGRGQGLRGGGRGRGVVGIAQEMGVQDQGRLPGRREGGRQAFEKGAGGHVGLR